MHNNFQVVMKWGWDDASHNRRHKFVDLKNLRQRVGEGEYLELVGPAEAGNTVLFGQDASIQSEEKAEV